jgi:hypothetical protein
MIEKQLHVQSIKQMHRDLAKLLELRVSAEWLAESGINPEQAKRLLMGIIYLREMYPNATSERKN